MKLINSLNSRQVKRMQSIKFLQQKKIASEYDKINTIKIKSANVLKKKHWKTFFPVKYVLFRRGCKKDYEHYGSFQEAIGPVLVLAQVFSLMPVRGITAKSAHQLSFSWCYLRTIYSLVAIICFGFCSGFAISYALSGRFNFDEAETIVFHTSIFLIAMAFFNLSRKWPALLVHWEDVERRLPTLKTQQQKGWLAQRIKMITLVATTCSLMEHLLSMLSLIYYANNCPGIPNNPIESYLLSNFIQFFHFVKYSTFAGVIGKVLNVLATFAWNFNDIFVMTVSVALSARFRQLNDYMLKAVKRPTTEQFWIQNRVNYRNLCKLCEAVDAAISPITLLCFSNNLYFICGKILKSLQKKPSFTHTVYFWFSLGYLLGRTLILSLFTSDINEEAKRPVTIFRGISRENWCCELKRFSDEVSTDVVALSGMKFFHLTRSSVLTVAGTIVTYELVLLQFNKADKINDCFED